MISPPTLDPQTLLAPFEGESLAGQDPRADMSPSSRFLQMKDARTGARRKERALDVDADAAAPTDEWSEVAESACLILSEVGKDLEVAAWLVEALLRLDGVPGLFTGLKVAQGLVEGFWDTVHPLPDEEGNEPRLAPFIALNGSGGDGTLTQALRKIPLTSAGHPLWQYEQARDIETLADPSKREARLADGALSLEKFMEAMRETPAAFYASLLDDVAEARRSLDGLSDAFAARVGRDAPPAGGLRAILQDVEDAVRVIAADKLLQVTPDPLPDAPADAAEAGEAAGGEDGPAPARTLPAGRPLGREDAFRQLLHIAAYFRETEPHSPISYSLEEVVRRGRLPLPQLLDELIMDADARRFFFIASGVKPKEEVE
ncbi:type VI secretion system protein TssA [Methylobacterium oryzihabitans]|uniref:Type VI secretion system protein TssA n=1 Tax=Methylobacterium oryzihabitans TaxID=2499852 RepID=A0A3S2VNH3_9HYPH|nr:type VI secretion system protein TssA [Methylobacterium oryzihabitans]RVU16927.1 type VI secretion system protein TssA [Methylobacterium oryzihabitans]